MSGATLKKCPGVGAEGLACPDKWACARYYVPEGAAGWLSPGPCLSEMGCMDYVALAGDTEGARRDGRRGFSHFGYIPGAGGGD